MSSNLVISKTIGEVGLIQLNDPERLNALSPMMLAAIANAAEQFHQTRSIRVIVIAGNEKAFAAGADITTLSTASSQDILDLDTLQYWSRIRSIPLPLIAAVSGYVFGGGLELAMLCDLIIASESTKFAQPEIKLGIIPGGGGTQRLAKAIGPYKAMEMILTGEPISAQDAFALNLVNRVVPIERYLDEALELAAVIASRPPIAVLKARDSVRYGVEHTLIEGLKIEREAFVQLFDTEDQAEGMSAFLEKRQPRFKGK